MVQKTHEWFQAASPYILALMTGLLCVICYFAAEKNSQLADMQSSLQDLNTQIAVMQGNRFTSQDGKEVWQEISGIKTAMAAMPTEVPPAWFREYVEGVAATVLENKIQLGIVCDTVKRIEEKM